MYCLLCCEPIDLNQYHPRLESTFSGREEICPGSCISSKIFLGKFVCPFTIYWEVSSAFTVYKTGVFGNLLSAIYKQYPGKLPVQIWRLE